MTQSADTQPEVTPSASEAEAPAPAARRRGQDLMLPLQRFAMETERYGELTRARVGLAHQDVRAITEVMEGERAARPLSVGALARRLVLSASATTTVIQRLGARGHMVRAADDGDRRGARVQCTATARETAQQMFREMVEELLEEFVTWEDADLEVLLRRIPQLTEAVVRAQHRLDADGAAARP